MEWISVKDRLPKHGEKVLTCDKFGNIHIFVNLDGLKFPFGISPNHSRFYEPTHWMPLPEPPEENA